MTVHDELLARLPYFDRHSDTRSVSSARAVSSRARAQRFGDPFRGAGVMKLVGIEARAFIVATAVALAAEAPG